MKPTYTREQLEALRDCRKCGCCKNCIMILDCTSPSRDVRAIISADLLSTLDEIERLRTALEMLLDPEADSDESYRVAYNALKETTNEH